jgi:hypothetical protein
MKTQNQHKSKTAIVGTIVLFAVAIASQVSAQAGTSGGGVIVRELPHHLRGIGTDINTKLFKQAKVDEAIAILLANPEYVNHPASTGRFELSLCYAIKGQWDLAAQVLGGMTTVQYVPMVYAFSGQIELARKEYAVRFNPDSNPEDPQSPYLAQGDSVRALQANTAFYYAWSGEGGSHPWLRRHFLRVAYELAPEAPLIALRYARYAEPDIRKGLAILDTLQFPTNRFLRDNLASAKDYLGRRLKEAERGERPFILEYRTKAP